MENPNRQEGEVSSNSFIKEKFSSFCLILMFLVVTLGIIVLVNSKILTTQADKNNEVVK